MGVKLAINCRLKYIELDGASCPFNMRLNFVINGRLKYIKVEGALCPVNMSVNLLYMVC